MLQRPSCSESPACTSEDEEDEDPGSPQGLPPVEAGCFQDPGEHIGGSHL